MFFNAKSGFEEGYAKKDNLEIYYRDYGPLDGIPVLLVMGLGGQLTFWPPYMIKRLQDSGYRPIAYDNRDMGFSTRFKSNPTFLSNYLKYYLNIPIKSEYKLDDMANDAVMLIDYLNIKKSHVIGMSMGGMISQILVANYPERFHSYTQIASMVSTPNPTNGPSFKVIRLLQERAFKNATKEERIDRAVRLVSTIGMKGYNYNTEEFKDEVGQSIDRSKDDTGFIRQMAAILGTRDRIQKVNNIKIPTLIIHGDIDPLVKPKNAFHSHKLIPNSKLLMIENMGHLIEEPVFNKFKNELIQHLDKNC
jgi:pimeloyl-ACP methyl ester carboxylesterase